MQEPQTPKLETLPSPEPVGFLSCVGRTPKPKTQFLILAGGCPAGRTGASKKTVIPTLIQTSEARWAVFSGVHHALTLSPQLPKPQSPLLCAWLCVVARADTVSSK